MPIWLKGLLGFLVLLGGAFVVVAVWAYFHYNAWNHKPNKKEKEEVRSLKEQEKKLRNANHLDEAKEISKKIDDIKKHEIGDPKYERAGLGFFMLSLGLLASFIFPLPFYLMSENISFFQFFKFGYFLVGGACLFGALFEWLNLFPNNENNASRFYYAVGLHYGSLALTAYLERNVKGDELHLYLISIAICLILCFIIWLTQKK